MSDITELIDHKHNQIIKLDRKLSEIGIKIRKDENSKKVKDDVFDEVTLLSLYKLANKKIISAIGGSISTGKEANVFLADGNDKYPHVAVKIYRLRTGNFTTMTEYIVGDPRFSNIRHTHKDIVFAWTKKEYSNLSRVKKAGILCPTPLDFNRNILIMEYMGENGIPYPQLRQKLPKDPLESYQDAINLISDLYNKAHIVHGDLSEYNLLTKDEDLVVIDMGQSIAIEHPKSYEYMIRDIKNINRFFADKCKITNEQDIFRDIVGEKFFEI
ncbi:MAG TPA: serine protein kinase RIO [Methanocorpusculum sp.]|nr:serine protein kinase RIO [Methanocorpusculum sp.]